MGQNVSQRGLKVDKEKIEVIEKPQKLISVKDIHNFPRHEGFYHRFLNFFSRIALLLCKLMEMELKFYFDDVCMEAFKCFKVKLISTPVISSIDWWKPFELVCDSCRTTLVVVLVQKYGKLIPSSQLRKENVRLCLT